MNRFGGSRMWLSAEMTRYCIDEIIYDHSVQRLQGKAISVKKVLEQLVVDGPEVGLQVAAYLDGKLVIDTWAGLADAATRKPVDGDTLFMLSSTTKGVTATCAAVL